MVYESKWGTRYEDCYIVSGRYPNGNLALQLMSESEGTLMTITTNPGVELSDDEIAVKDWSENEGIVEWLFREGLVEYIGEGIRSGYVVIPICYPTDKLRDMI